MKKMIIMMLSLLVLLFPMSTYAQGYDTIQDNGVKYISLSGNIIKSFDEEDEENEEGVCPLGPDVTKDLYGALMILKIVAPLLCIGLSVFEAIKAVAKGDPSTDLKVVAKKFSKRMVYALALFFIPVIVDVFFQMADVWGAHGTCNLMSPVENNYNSNKNQSTYEPLTKDPKFKFLTFNYTSAIQVCSSKVDRKSCVSAQIDGLHKCTWGEGMDGSKSNTCVYKGNYFGTDQIEPYMFERVEEDDEDDFDCYKVNVNKAFEYCTRPSAKNDKDVCESSVISDKEVCTWENDSCTYRSHVDKIMVNRNDERDYYFKILAPVEG